jgi:DNA-binding HxlR family transcriptional regulator
MRWQDYESDSCSIARALASLGDRWTVLILRDLFNGGHRFDELLDHLGVSRDVLSRRLATMVEDGIVERRPYREAGSRPRSDYRLTPAGRELQPVLIALLHWGDRHRATEDGPPTRLEHVGCGGEVGLRLTCSEGHDVPRGEVANTPQAGARLRTRVPA